jgi:hypothetical protein
VNSMMDLICVAAAAVFFGLSWRLVQAAGRLL